MNNMHCNPRCGCTDEQSEIFDNVVINVSGQAPDLAVGGEIMPGFQGISAQQVMITPAGVNNIISCKFYYSEMSGRF